MDQPKPSLDDLRIERKTGPELRSKSWPVFVVVLILLLFGGGAWWWRARADVIEVRTVAVREIASGGPERTVLNASGYVTARRAATVSSKITGKVVEVLIEE